MTWLQFWLWVASLLISDYFRARLPSQTASGIGDFNIPTATEGRVVPIVTGGTVRCDAPNCIWYGNFEAEARTTTTGLVFKKEETIGYRYKLALQYALFKGEGKGITGIWIGDEQVFNHVDDAAGVPQEVIDIDEPDLFGGKDGAGGFVGRIRLHNGSETQPVSSFLANVAGLDPLPAYRGTCYVMITNKEYTSLADSGLIFVTVGAETEGANIGHTNNLRYIRIEVQTFDVVAATGLGDSLGLGNDHHFIGPDANPMSVAYELYINNVWGRAFPPSDVDAASFKAAAEVCYTEGIGYTQLIDELTTTGQIQDTIEQHIDGYIGPNPITGRIEVVLSRPDYVLANEYQANDDNIVEVQKYAKGDWAQTFNRVRIRYTDRDKQWNESHAIELSPGNRIIQGRTKTKELRYQGVHTASVARIIAARAKRTLSLPQSFGTLVLDRTAWELRPGSVLSFTSSQAEETNVALRVTKAGLGDGMNNSMQVEVVADLSGNETPTTAQPPPTDFVPPIQTVVPFALTDQAAFEAPYLLMREDPSPDSPPRIATIARRAQDNPATEYQVVRRHAAGTPIGAYTVTDDVQAGFAAVGVLRNAAPKGEAGNGTLTMVVDPTAVNESLDGLIGTYSPAAGNMAGVAVISPGLATEEFLLFTSVVDDVDGIRLEGVYRSAMDTSWQAHDAGATLWFLWAGGLSLGPEIYPVGNNVELKLLPISPNDSVLEAAATALPIVALDDVTDSRNSKPLPPAIVTLNGTEFPTEVNFDGTHTLPDPDVVGLEAIPTHRLWRVPNIQWSVQGLNIIGAAMTDANVADEVMELSAWIHDLDTNPGAERTAAVGEVLDQAIVTPTDPFYIEKDDMIAAGAVGFSFNARLEIEIKHSPPGESVDNVSHDSFEADFLATGIFSIEPEGSILTLGFEGEDTDTLIDDNSRFNSPVLAVGNAQVDTAQSVFGDASGLFDGAGDVFALLNRQDQMPWSGDWTIDFRVRFNTVATTQCIIVQGAGIPWRGAGIRWAPNVWQLIQSTNGSGAYNSRNLASHTPVAGTWYAIRILKQGLNQLAVYVDGTRIGTHTYFNTWVNASADWTVGGLEDGAGIVQPFDGNIDQLRVFPVALLQTTDTSYTVETERFYGEAQVDVPLLLNFEDTDESVTYRSDDRNKWELTYHKTTAVDTAQAKFGSSSLRVDGVMTGGNDADGLNITKSVDLGTLPLRPFSMRSDDWTMQCFVYYNALPSTNSSENAGMAMLGQFDRGNAGGDGDARNWLWWIDASDRMNWLTGVSGTKFTSLGVTLATGQWYHFAVQRRGRDVELYFDGDRLAIHVNEWLAGADLVNDGGEITIGRNGSVTGSATRLRSLDGWMDGVEIRRGECLFEGATYTVPTVAPGGVKAAGDDTLLLWHPEGPNTSGADHVYAESSLRGARAFFNVSARLSTSRFKFGTSSLNVFASSTHYAAFAMSRFWYDLADGDFTMDLWVNPDVAAVDGGRALLNIWEEAGDERGWRFDWNDTDDALEFVWTTNGAAATEKRVYADLADLTLDVWTHLAVERIGTAVHLYANGVLLTNNVGSDSIGTEVIYNPPDRELLIGYQDVTAFEGNNTTWFDEIRITKTSEYGGATFTPETAVYPDPVLPNL